MDMKELLEESALYVMNTYKRFPVVFRKGRGIRLWSYDGKEYLDFMGGVAVNVLGHCHPRVVIALQKQAQRLLHVSNFYHIGPQIKLAKLLVGNSFADKAFFCNSGAEANEAAIKLARKYAREHAGPERFEIITALNSFHGRTYGSLSATGQTKLQKGFEPMLPGFRYVPFDDPASLGKAVTAKTAAVMLEPVQGEGGVKIPGEGYFKEVRRICDEHGLLLMLDEVQTGMGRTGKLFAYEHFGITPDIMTIAKGLGGGAPIGALLATERVARSFGPGDHGSTFGGNPLVCAAAVATLETVVEDDLLIEHSKRMGAYLKETLESLKERHSSVVTNVRAMGLLAGMELARECAPVVKACMEKGMLINCTSENVLRFMPPLIVEKRDIEHMAGVLSEVLERLS